MVAGSALVMGTDDPVRAQLRGLTVLSALFGMNHAVAVVHSNKPGNGAWAVLNAGGMATGLAALSRPRS